MLSELKHQLILLLGVIVALIVIGVFLLASGYTTPVFAIFAIDCVIVICVYAWFWYSVVEPLKTIYDFSKKMAQGGQYGTVMKVSGNDELSALARQINDMSEKIAISEKARTDFVSQISHELRTPLTAINGWAETIAFDPALEGDSKTGLQIITKEAKRLSGMVDELLEYTRIQDGRFYLNIEDVDIVAELEDALFTYRDLFSQEGIETNYGIANNDIPIIPGDPIRLKQVFTNIFGNAIKHGGDGKKIDVSIGRDDVSAIIVIRDYGPGIPENELPHVKEKFYKGTSKKEGSGIGLSVCEEIIARHNGWMEIANANGGGCIVTIRLPLTSI